VFGLCMTAHRGGVVLEARSAEATRHYPLVFQNEISVDSHVMNFIYESWTPQIDTQSPQINLPYEVDCEKRNCAVQEKHLL
jgi:hypothetical protein